MRRQREEEAQRQREEEELGVMAYKTAEEAKLAGNKFIGAEDYKKALECYTRAIELDETVPAYFGNRGQCHLKLGDWRAALADSMKAVEVDAAGTFGKGWIRAGVCFQPHRRGRVGAERGSHRARWAQGLPRSAGRVRGGEGLPEEGDRHQSAFPTPRPLYDRAVRRSGSHGACLV